MVVLLVEVEHLLQVLVAKSSEGFLEEDFVVDWGEAQRNQEGCSLHDEMGLGMVLWGEL